METIAEFETEKASRYLASLCQHFGHKVPVQVDGDTGRIELPFGHCAMTASDTRLDLVVRAKNQADLEKAADVIGSHLERFAFRENPNVEWAPVRKIATDAD